jgi:hypothetical protein
MHYRSYEHWLSPIRLSTRTAQTLTRPHHPNGERVETINERCEVPSCLSQRTALEGEIARLKETLASTGRLWQRSLSCQMQRNADLVEAEAALTALTAEHASLRKEHDTLLRAIKEPVESIFPRLPKALARIDKWREQEAALAVAVGYVTHKADCRHQLTGSQLVHNSMLKAQGKAPLHEPTCTCGAAAVLSQKGPVT